MSSNDKTAVAVEEKKEKAEVAEEKKAASADGKKTDEADKKEVKAAVDEDGEELSEDFELFHRRESLALTPEIAEFKPSVGGMVSLTLHRPDGEDETFERVIILRSFPVTSPTEFLSIREPDSKDKGRGEEIGMIRRLSDFPEDARALINKELSLRYFTPEIKRICNAKEKFGFHYWDVDTTAGKISIILTNPYSNIRVLEDKRVYISDMDGNCFIIPDASKLDKASFRRIDVYI